MLYLVGGAPRAGKTNLSKRFLEATGIPYFGIDYLKMGIARGLPEFGLDPNSNDMLIARKLWPIVRGMVRTYVENEETCLLEGAYFLPEYVAELREELPGQIRSCFIGYAEIDTKTMVRQLRHYDDATMDLGWVDGDDSENVEFLKAFSRYVKEECEKHSLKYFENSTNYWKTLDAAVRYLSESRETSSTHQ